MTRDIPLPSRSRDATQVAAQRWAEKRAQSERERQLVRQPNGDWIVP